MLCCLRSKASDAGPWPATLPGPGSALRNLFLSLTMGHRASYLCLVGQIQSPHRSGPAARGLSSPGSHVTPVRRSRSRRPARHGEAVAEQQLVGTGQRGHRGRCRSLEHALPAGCGGRRCQGRRAGVWLRRETRLPGLRARRLRGRIGDTQVAGAPSCLASGSCSFALPGRGPGRGHVRVRHVTGEPVGRRRSSWGAG